MSNPTEILIEPAIRPEAKPAAGTWRPAQVKPTFASRRWQRAKALTRDAAIGALLPVFVLAAWQWAGDRGLISPLFLPTPRVIAQTLGDLLQSGELLHHLGISARRAAIGFVLGGGLGLLLGLAAGLSRRTAHTLDPTVQMLRMIPHLAIAPLIILWLGFGEASKIAIIAKGAFFPLYLNAFMGIRGVDVKLHDVSRVLAFGRRERIRRLILPAALPQILLGLRMSLALSWIGLVVAELIASTSGVGFLINVGKQSSDTALIFAGVIVFGIVGKLVDSFVRLLERRWLHWRDAYEG